MNISTFRDAVQSRKASLANDLDVDDDDDREIAPLRREVDGEEDEGKEKVIIPHVDNDLFIYS
jgi:hypothetical protein